MFFMGIHTPKLDDKGRLILPAKFRERLASGLVVTKGQERCLYLYPYATFAEIAAKVTSGPTSNKAVRDYQRMLLSGASDEVPDKQGRITIPQVLRAYAALQTDCTVVGSGDRIEVWDSVAWQAYEADVEDAFANQSEEVVPGLM